MIEKALYEHLQSSADLAPHLAHYAGKLAVFNQQAPADTDPLWEAGKPQYARVVFAVDIQGDPERAMGGNLLVDIQCQDGAAEAPEDLEPIVRSLIDGYFFSSGMFTVAAQWKDSSYFSEPTPHVVGVTISFSLLAFPVITTGDPDPIAQLNEWTASTFEGVHVINHESMPSVWRPDEKEVAIYWRIAKTAPAGWIRDNFQTTYRTATIKGHIFAPTIALIGEFSKEIVIGLYAKKRLYKPGTSPIIVNQNNIAEIGADPLRTGQITVEATYGEIIHRTPVNPLNNIHVNEK